MMNRTATAAMALLLTGAMTLCSCSAATPGPTSSPVSAVSGTITIWVDLDREQALAPIASSFQQQTGITVNLVVKDPSTLVDEFAAQARAGSGPDAIIAPHDRVGMLASTGAIAPIDLGSTAADFQSGAVQAFTFGGKTYGVPFAVEGQALIRNTALAKNAPATWNDVIAAGKQAGTPLPILIGGMNSPARQAYNLYPLQQSFGAPVLGARADGSYDTSRLAMGGGNGRAFAAWLGAQAGAGVLRPAVTPDVALAEFLAGNAPFLVTGPWDLGQIKQAGITYAVDPIPRAGPYASSPFVSVEGLVMSAHSHNQAAVQKFLLSRIATKDDQTAIYKMGDRPPANLAALKDASSDPGTAAFAAIAAEGVPLPNSPVMDQLWAAWSDAEARIIAGSAGDPATAWDDMTSRLQAKLG